MDEAVVRRVAAEHVPAVERRGPMFSAMTYAAWAAVGRCLIDGLGDRTRCPVIGLNQGVTFDAALFHFPISNWVTSAQLK